MILPLLPESLRVRRKSPGRFGSMLSCRRRAASSSTEPGAQSGRRTRSVPRATDTRTDISTVPQPELEPCWSAGDGNIGAQIPELRAMTTSDCFIFNAWDLKRKREMEEEIKKKLRKNKRAQLCHHISS